MLELLTNIKADRTEAELTRLQYQFAALISILATKSVISLNELKEVAAKLEQEVPKGSI